MKKEINAYVTAAYFGNFSIVVDSLLPGQFWIIVSAKNMKRTYRKHACH